MYMNDLDLINIYMNMHLDCRILIKAVNALIYGNIILFICICTQIFI